MGIKELLPPYPCPPYESNYSQLDQSTCNSSLLAMTAGGGSRELFNLINSHFDDWGATGDFNFFSFPSVEKTQGEIQMIRNQGWLIKKRGMDKTAAVRKHVVWLTVGLCHVSISIDSLRQSSAVNVDVVSHVNVFVLFVCLCACVMHVRAIPRPLVPPTKNVYKYMRLMF